MSLNILLDPVYSAGPSRCSTAFKCSALVHQVLDVMGREDVFFYWMIPDWASEEDIEWLPKHPNIKYIEFPYFKDRMREYIRYPAELDDIQAFNGLYWDFDILFTSRTAIVPMTATVMSSPRQTRNGRFLKKIIIIEEMFVMQFRGTVAKSNIPMQEILGLAGYLEAHKVYLQTDLERRCIANTARRYYSPTNVRKIDQNVIQAIPVLDLEIKPKKKKDMFKKGERKFCLSFTGRLENISSNLEKVYKTMTRQFIMNDKDAFKILVCTVSTASKFMPPEFVDLRRPKRDEFWRLAREEMDVMLVLHNDAEFSLSLVEPLILGVPAIIIDQEWAHSVYGDDYPFYAKNEVEFFALINLFHDNYKKQYKIFKKWQQSIFKAEFEGEGRFAKNMFEEMGKEVNEIEKSIEEYVLDKYEDRSTGNVSFDILLDCIKDKDEFVLFDVLEDNKDKLPILGEKVRDRDRDTRRLVNSTPWNDMRQLLKVFYGWEDASTTVGHFKRKK